MRQIVGLLIVALLQVTASAADAVKLEHKFPEGSKLVFEKEEKTSQSLVLAGMNVDSKSTSFTVESRTIGKRASDGTLQIINKVESTQVDVSLPGGLSFQFDTANPEKKIDNPILEPIVEAVRVVSTVPITVELDAENKIKSAQLPAGEFDKLSDAVKDQFKPEWLKKYVEKSTQYLPDGPVKKGDSWERTSEVNPGSGQTLTFKTKYEYVGTVEVGGKTYDKITATTVEAGYSVEGNPMLQVKNVDLKVAASEGTYLFDRELGVAVSRTSKMQIVGPLTLVVMGNELPGKLDLTIEETVKKK